MRRTLAVVASLAAVATVGASAANAPRVVYAKLGTRATWSVGLPPSFSLAGVARYPSGDPGIVGQVFVYLKGPLAGQGLGFVVTTSRYTAAQTLYGIVKEHQAKPAVDGPANSFRWTAPGEGANSACDSAQVACFETSRAVQVGDVVVVATVGSTKRGDHRAWRLQLALFNAAIARLKSLEF